MNYEFKDKDLLALSFVHRSFVNEHRDTVKEHNERLEFLGDTVLSILIAEYLYREYPDKLEGEMSRLRSRLVEASACIAYAQKLDIEEYVLLSKGERMNGGRGRESILADLFEAVIGAIYLDGGIDASKDFLFDNFFDEIKDMIAEPAHNWKAELQDFVQKRFQQTPKYEVFRERGPDHNKIFEVFVVVNNKKIAAGEGGSKKEAQQAAASAALDKIKQMKF